MNLEIIKQLAYIRDARQRLLLALQERAAGSNPLDQIAVEQCKIDLARLEIDLINEAQKNDG